MEELFRVLMQGEVTAMSMTLLLLFLVISGRLVPWWQVNDYKEQLKAANEKLDDYEDKAPRLIEEVQTLINLKREEIELIKQDNSYAYTKRQPRIVNQARKPLVREDN